MTYERLGPRTYRVCYDTLRLELRAVCVVKWHDRDFGIETVRHRITLERQCQTDVIVVQLVDEFDVGQFMARPRARKTSFRL